METAVKYFAVFGGLEVKLDMTKDLKELIQTNILDDYRYLRNEISQITGGNNIYHTILTGLALGDRRTNSAFRRAKVSFDNGIDDIDHMCELGVITLEKSHMHLTRQARSQTVSERLLFNSPYLRFWFAFISPIFKGIKEGNYEEFFKKYEAREAEFADLVFEELSHEFLKDLFKDDEFKQLGRYWDDNNEVVIVGKTFSGKIVVGDCKFSNNKAKKSMLTSLKKTCDAISFVPDIYVLFSNAGYTSELKSQKSDTLKLFSSRNFKTLLD